MIPDRAGNVENWDFDKLLVILLRQFKRLLAERGVELTDAQMQQIGAAVAARQPITATEVEPLHKTMAAIIAESVEVLRGWSLTYVQALNTEMTDMPGWETTAEFLDIANHKVNAELRISAGASLLTALGDPRYAHFLLQTIQYDLDTYNRLDVDATLARRTLLFAAHIDEDAPDWLAQAQAWVASI